MKRWVETHVLEFYMKCLEDPSQLKARTLMKKCSPLDHVFAVLACIEKREATTNERKDKLATVLFTYG